jgi:hypothetical protein
MPAPHAKKPIAESLDPEMVAVRAAVDRSPKPRMLIISASVELFSEADLRTLKRADGVVIDLDAPSLSTNVEQIQHWITIAYDEDKQVFVAGKPETLANSLEIRKRDVTIIPKTREYTSLKNQELANAITERFQRRYADRIHRRSHSGTTDVPTKTKGGQRTTPTERVRQIDPIHYKRALTVQEEKELDLLLNDYDR